MKHEKLVPPEGEQTQSNRGRENRRDVALPAHIICENGDITSADVLDLSYDGCCVETPIELQEGATVKLSVVALGTNDAQVRWYANGKAGLSFAIHSTWEREIKPRNAERIELCADLSLRRVGRQNYRARVFDISPEGCKVEFVERPRLDELVWVKFESLESVEAAVCWVDGFYGGLKFLRPIYPAVFDLLLTRLLDSEDR
ncbi:MAG TPA: PilZ domain-containing protein [Sphingomicrobium sp.]|nr:PilZ domain-containing protein [Sphingomicrobium sp.]